MLGGPVTLEEIYQNKLNKYNKQLYVVNITITVLKFDRIKIFYNTPWVLQSSLLLFENQQISSPAVASTPDNRNLYVEWIGT